MENIKLSHIATIIIILISSLVLVVALWYLPLATPKDLIFNHTFLLFLIAGFVAQIVDGALGMAYGVTSSSMLLSFGLSPKLASTAVHTAEVFTTAASGMSHMRMGNFDKKLFFRLLIPGVISAGIGAFFLSSMVDGNIIKPFISAYLLILGAMILYRSFRPKPNKAPQLKNAGYYALFGGFLDAVGGGGWGPFVTSNLIREGISPKIVIGTVNTVEFFVTFLTAGILIYFTGIQSWQIILGLILGGTLAAPIGAWFANKVAPKTMMILVGCLIIASSLFTIFSSALFLSLF